MFVYFILTSDFRSYLRCVQTSIPNWFQNKRPKKTIRPVFGPRPTLPRSSVLLSPTYCSRGWVVLWPTTLPTQHVDQSLLDNTQSPGPTLPSDLDSAQRGWVVLHLIPKRCPPPSLSSSSPFFPQLLPCPAPVTPLRHESQLCFLHPSPARAHNPAKGRKTAALDPAPCGAHDTPTDHRRCFRSTAPGGRWPDLAGTKSCVVPHGHLCSDSVVAWW